MLLNKELVINGDFSAWTTDNPDNWTVSGEVGSDPEISEVGIGEGHGGVGTGYCNIYSSGAALIEMEQAITTLVVGRKYRFSVNLNTLIANRLRILDFSGHSQFTSINYNSTGIKTFTFVAVHTDLLLRLKRADDVTCDITFDNVSIRAEVPAELSRTGHSFASRQEI